MPDSYSTGGYGRMLADTVRTAAYEAALAATVRPGDVVVDLGTGTGAFALLAARMGARRVYAIDPADAIVTAAALARANGLADRIEFIQQVSTRVTLPEPAQVVVADLRGTLPAFQEILASLRDARERFLAPGGVLIPRADVLLAAPVEAPREWADRAGPDWVLGLDFSLARERALNDWGKVTLSHEQLLAEGVEWARMEYGVPRDPQVRGEARWRAGRDGVAHGLGIWFRAELCEGIGFSSGPDSGTIYQTGFFPFPRPLPVREGDEISATLSAVLAAGEYVWNWQTRFHLRQGEAVEFSQSSFLTNPPSPSRLRRRADLFVPARSEEAEITLLVLQRMDGGHSLAAIAEELRGRFPRSFPTAAAALARVGVLSEQFAQ